MSKLVDTSVEVVKASPAITITGAILQKITLQDWVYIATLGYIVLQAGWLLWKWYRAAQVEGWTPKDD